MRTEEVLWEQTTKNKSEIKKPTFEIASKDMTINGKNAKPPVSRRKKRKNKE